MSIGGVRRAALALVVVLIAGLSAGCSPVPKAEKVVVEIDDDTVTMASPSSGVLSRAGEVVLTVKNFSHSTRQMLLVRTDLPVTALPSQVLAARSSRDDGAVVAVTDVMHAVRTDTTVGLPVKDPSVTNLHIYLKPGARYLLLDRLGGYRSGVWIEILSARRR